MASKVSATTQQFVPIGEIKDNTVVMRDGSMRAVLAVASINFGLKSDDEQNATISAYRQFLNTLDFPLQIVIQSRKLDIDEYLERLGKAEKEQTNELLRLQIKDYRAFVKELVQLGEIMSKRFYVVIPYNAASDKNKSFWSRLFEVFQVGPLIRLKDDRFRRHKGALDQRIGHVQSALASAGLKSEVLDTQALIELYYQVYNPDVSTKEKLGDVGKIRLDEGGL